MTQEEKLAEYARQRLGGREIPADLRILLVRQWQPGTVDADADPLATMGVALLGSHVFEDVQKFAQLKESFAKVGIPIGADSWDELPYPRPPTDPASFHEERYEENRSKAGLPAYR